MSKATLLVALLALVGCRKEPNPTPNPPLAAKPVAVDRDPDFWKWVAAHIDELKGVKTGRESVTLDLSAELAKVQPGLVFELGVGKEDFELIISADGRKNLFPVVKRLVSAAPPIPGTKVIAFRPRKDVSSFSMQVGAGQLSGKDLWFVARADAGRPGLAEVDVFVRGMTPVIEEPLRNAAFLLLEASVGEFDLETKIGGIEFFPAPDKPEAPLKPLKELPAVLDAWK